MVVSPNEPMQRLLAAIVDSLYAVSDEKLSQSRRWLGTCSVLFAKRISSQDIYTLYRDDV
jgi:hypothetical protein